MQATKTLTFAFLLALFVSIAASQTPAGEQVTFSNGALKLGGFIAKPPGKGPFPAVVWNHGSGSNPNPRMSRLAPFWVSHGFVFFEPHRRGYGLSASAGPDIQETVDEITKRAGAAAVTLSRRNCSQRSN